MTDIKETCGSEPDAPMWRCRALAIVRGRVPAHQRGDRVWVWFCERWVPATVTRTIPGGCYLAKLDRPIGGTGKVTVAATTYGGYVE